MSELDQIWEREVITKLAESSLKEQKRARNWGIFFKALTFIYLIALLMLFADSDLPTAETSKKHTALVNLNGLIADGEKASADNIVTALRHAFKNKNAAGVILRINSPGGTPVQAGYIYDEIIRLREEHPEIPLYAVISDICASGGYYVASAADKIFADKASIVGSIGVRMDNFGFVEAMEKLGIERRTLTAGKNKAMLDPFSPIDEEINKHMQSMLNNIHQQFIDSIKKSRGDRLNQDTEGLFSGLVWTGEQSLELGLVDDLASTSTVAREIIGEEFVIDYTLTEDLLERITQRIGAATASLLIKHNSTPFLN